MIGVNFQPGTQDQQQNGQQRTAPQNVQEAIRVLSLRLPKVVGANSVAPQALLGSQGGGANPRVDSVVQQILQRMFPQAAPPSASVPQAPAPMIPPPMPQAPPPPMGGGIDANGIPPANLAPPPSFPQTPAAPPYEPRMPTYEEPPRRAVRQEPSVDEAPNFWRRPPRVIIGQNPTLPDMPLPSFPQPREVPLTGGIPDWLRFGPNFGGGGGTDDGGPPQMV